MEENNTAADYFKEKIASTIDACNDVHILQFLESFCRLYIEKHKKEE